MSWNPIAHSVPQYMDANGDPYSGAVLKFYAATTSTNIVSATDSTGGTTQTDVVLNANGNPAVSGSVIIPHIDRNYKLSLYPNQASADSNTGSIWTVDSISINVGNSTANVTTSGAVGDGVTDDWAAIQAAYDAVGVAGGGEVFIPQQSGDYYLLSKALRLRYPNVTIRCESASTRVHVDSTGQGLGALNRWPNYGCVLMGTYTVNNVDQVSVEPLNSVTQGEETVTTTTAADADGYSIGDVVLVESTKRWDDGGGSTRPMWGQINVVTSTDGATGIIGMRHTIQETGTADILNLSDNGTNWLTSDGTDSGEAQFATRDNKILGGWWSTGVSAAPFSGGGGSIDCLIDIDRSSCRNGPAYGNLMAHSRYNITLQESRRSGVEMAYCSHDNVIDIITDDLVDFSDTTTASIWCNESSRNNTIRIQEHNGNNFANTDLIRLNSCNGNRVFVGTAYSNATTTAAIHILDPASTIPAGGSKTLTENNLATIGHLVGFTGVDYVRFTGNGMEGRNEVAGGKYYGSATNAIRFDGDAAGEDSVRDCWFETGGIVLPDASTDHSVTNCYVPDGLSLSGTNWDTELQSGDYIGMRTDKSKLLRQANNMDVAQNATNASPYTFTSTIPGNSFSSGSTLHFYCASAIPGSSSSSNKAWVIQLGGVAVRTYNTTSTGASEVIIKGCITYATATAYIAHLTIYQDDVCVATECKTISTLDATTDEDLTIVITPSNVSDTITMRHAQSKANAANTGEIMIV